MHKIKTLKDMLIKNATIYSILTIVLLFVACSSDNDFPGKAGDPQIQSPQVPKTAFFGDSIPFSAQVSDSKVPLSTLKAQLFYGEDMISETIIRTMQDGLYAGKIIAPFLKGVPDGTATMKLILQDIHFTLIEETFSIDLKRPQYDYITFVSESGSRVNLTRTQDNTYVGNSLEGDPKLQKGVFVAPKYGENGNSITFGWQGSGIKEGSIAPITFISVNASPYAMTFNTLTYERSPFTVYRLNGQDMNFVDGSFQMDIDLKKGTKLVTENIEGLDNYWIDPDFLNLSASGEISFAAIDGKYRIIAEEGQNPYFRIQTLDKDGKKATLKSDGTGAIWIAGYGIAKPSMNSGQPGWSPGKMLCMAPVAPKVYRLTAKATGEKGLGQIRTDYLGFKFFHQDNWGGEFGKTKYMEEKGLIPSIITISNGGDINLTAGKSLDEGKTYVITLDCTNGPDMAIITIEEK